MRRRLRRVLHGPRLLLGEAMSPFTYNNRAADSMRRAGSTRPVRGLPVTSADGTVEREASALARRAWAAHRVGTDEAVAWRGPSRGHRTAGERAVPSTGGRPLDAAVRSDVEGAFGHDFGRVRVHSGHEAADVARHLSARAYSVGHDIVLGPGESIHGAGNRHLLMHELAHIVQSDASSRTAVAHTPTSTAAPPPPQQRDDSTHALSATMRAAVPDVLHSQGQPLDTATRTRMENRLSHDFGQVRVHADARAANSARALGATAYTVGRDIVFGAGQYRPSTGGGDKLLAHELAHVIQQEAAIEGVRGAESAPVGGESLEGEAQAAAESVAGGRQSRVTGRASAAGLQRQQPQAHKVGELGELYLSQALDRMGYVVLPDASKALTTPGIDLVVFDPRRNVVWLMDNKSLARGIADAPALTGPQLPENLRKVKEWLRSNWASKEAAAALRALNAERYLKVISNFNAMGEIRFTPSLFTRGLVAYDARLMRLFTSHVEWEAAFGRLVLQRGIRLTGARGSATVGSVLITILAIAGSLYLYRAVGAKTQQLAGEAAGAMAVDALLVRIVGTSVGTIASLTLGLESDEPASMRERRKKIDEVIAALPELHYDKLSEDEQNEIRKTIGELVDNPLELPPPPPPAAPTYPVAPASVLARPNPPPPPLPPAPPVGRP
ncbi:DUF4157 domain-containing protein [Streptomyces griseoluteus]|uniref:eCIS core domain-containing protein n=1 Tax=Streptomyces griseoluteus TaxID=29306 RepID=UPI003681B68C